MENLLQQRKNIGALVSAQVVEEWRAIPKAESSNPAGSWFLDSFSSKSELEHLEHVSEVGYESVSLEPEYLKT